jgi:Multiubiquitin
LCSLSSNQTQGENMDKEEKDGNKEVTIIVNGRKKEISKKELSFAEVVALAFSVPPTGENILFTVTYRKGSDNKPEGTLIQGQSVKVKEGMIFNVTATDKS